MTERVQKLLASMGIASRREIESWIKQGRIKMNGKLVVLGDRAGSEDKIQIDGRRVHFKGMEHNKRRVLVYHKKIGEICTRSDPEGRPTVFSNLPKLTKGRWVAIGRLDINTSGLLLFTTDGGFANKLMHPSSEVPREYAVRVRGEVSDEMIRNMVDGVLLDDGLASFNDVVRSGGESQNQWYHVVLLEGKNREVRRLWESQGLSVSRLKRVRYGTIVLTQKVRQGKTLELNAKEIKSLDDILQPAIEIDEKPIEDKETKSSRTKKDSRTKKRSLKKGETRKGGGEVSKKDGAKKRKAKSRSPAVKK